MQTQTSISTIYKCPQYSLTLTLTQQPIIETSLLIFDKQSPKNFYTLHFIYEDMPQCSFLCQNTKELYQILKVRERVEVDCQGGRIGVRYGIYGNDEKKVEKVIWIKLMEQRCNFVQKIEHKLQKYHSEYSEQRRQLKEDLKEIEEIKASLKKMNQKIDDLTGTSEVFERKLVGYIAENTKRWDRIGVTDKMMQEKQGSSPLKSVQDICSGLDFKFSKLFRHPDMRLDNNYSAVVQIISATTSKILMIEPFFRQDMKSIQVDLRIGINPNIKNNGIRVGVCNYSLAQKNKFDYKSATDIQGYLISSDENKSIANAPTGFGAIISKTILKIVDGDRISLVLRRFEEYAMLKFIVKKSEDFIEIPLKTSITEYAFCLVMVGSGISAQICKEV